MLICEEYEELKLVDPQRALRRVIERQPDPEHVGSLILWAYHLIELGHKVEPGFALRGPTYKKAPDGAWVVDKENQKIGTHSGYGKTADFRNYDRPYYGWGEYPKGDKWTKADFNRAAIWLLTKPYEIMRVKEFEFNCLFFNTDAAAILDLDLYKQKIPSSTVQYIDNMVQKYAPTAPKVLSQAGGVHYYFDPDIPTTMRGSPAQGVDLLRNKGFVFFPPSRIRGGGSYMFQNINKPTDFPKQLPKMPEPIIRLFTPDKGSIVTRRPEHRGSFTEKQIQVLLKFLNEAESSGDRSAGDYAAVSWAKKIGMDFGQFWEFAHNRSKFAERGRDYGFYTWEKAL